MSLSSAWSEEERYRSWFRIELECLRVWVELARVPKSILSGVEACRFDCLRLKDIEKETHHEMTALTRMMAETVLDSDFRSYIHLGLTSSDVMDTAHALAMRRTLQHCIVLLGGLRHELVTPNLVRVRGCLPVVSVGKFSGAVGTYLETTPEFEAKVCARLGLVPDTVSSQIVQRDRHAQYFQVLALLSRSLSVMGASYGPECVAAFSASMESQVLWHERDLTHSSVERVFFESTAAALDRQFEEVLGVSA